jgi:hypothetical protein
MKGKIVVLLIAAVSMSVSFFIFGSTPLYAKEKGERTVYIVPDSPPAVYNNRNPEARKEWEERYKQLMQRKRELHRKTARLHNHVSIPYGGVGGVSITAITNSLNATQNYAGNYVFMGSCVNGGSDSAVFTEANVEFFDENNRSLGTHSTYVQGGTNVKLTSTGSFTNALGSNETGFFRVSTDIAYGSVKRTELYFSYALYGHTAASAALAFVGSPRFSSGYSDNVKVEGQVKNSSSNYLTYFTEAYFALFNASEQMIGLDSSYVIGTTYNTGIVTTDTALQPGATGTVDTTLDAPYREFSTFQSSFEWNEKNTSNMSEQDPPFGTFDTPLDGSTVSSSIPVTGWVLDDSGVESVKIYRNENGNQVYIGDASFVEGARPDVAAAYPDYPNNTSAGWGYMMLTNFLPGGGNGTFEISAVATDAVGKTTTLGTRTIHVDNDNAVKPFGAIDTPTQGGTISGSSYYNWGWVLTPTPNSIPTDGSTINVWVDGVNVGNPTYNLYREDIATFFPGYANSDGAVGFFALDTTGYADGVHTIQWTATDTGKNSDGIGSRFFTISNPRLMAGTGQAANTEQQPEEPRISLAALACLPDAAKPVRLMRGYDDNAPRKTIRRLPEGAGHSISAINVKPMERIVLHLGKPGKTDDSGAGIITGYHVIDGKLEKLPLGSTLDSTNGIFYWIPPQGFMGRHQLVFLETAMDGTVSKRIIFVDIVPNGR